MVIQEYAREMLEKTGQSRLPIQDKEVTSKLGATAISYSKAREMLQNMGHWTYAQTVKGLSFYVDDVPYICYMDKLSIVERRNVILHECGHIYLGHIDSEGGILGKCSDQAIENEQEMEANAFAVASLAPLHLLRANGIKTTQGIQRACRVSAEDAAIAAKALVASAHPFRKYLLSAVLAVVGATLAIGLIYNFNHSTPPLPTTSAPPIVSVSAPAANAPVPTDTYYWTKGGEVYHIDSACSALKQAKYPVQSGGMSEAQSHKPRPCRICTAK